MSWFEKITSWFNTPTTPPRDSTTEQLQAMLETARLYRRQGDYQNALNELARALPIAESLQNESLPLAIRLHQADILIREGNLDEARQILTTLREQTDDTQKPHQSYIQIALGMLEQAAGHIEQARHHYERAIHLAEEVHAIGAHGRAQGHLADIYLQEENASYAVYLFQESLAKLNASGDVEMACYFVGRFGEAMMQTGKTSEGLQLMGRALRMAEQLSYREYEIRWRQVLSFQAMQQGNYDEARRHLMMLLTQLNSEREPEDYVLVLCRIAKACMRLSEHTAALDYAQQAVDFVEQLGNPQPLYLMSQAARGIALRTAGKPAQALMNLSVAAAHYTDLPEADFSAIDVLRNLGAAQTDATDFDAAYETYQQALNVATSQHDVAGIHRDIGIYHARKHDLDAALQSWTTALKIYDEEGDNARVARLYCDIANVRRSYGQSKRALRDYEQALMLLNTIKDDETRGIVLSNAATAYVDYGDVETAEAFFVESVQIAQRLQDRQSEATRRGNYGWFLLNTGRAKLAIQTLEYALRQSENLGLKLQAAVQTDNIGSAYDELLDDENALIFHAKAWEKIKLMDDPHWKAFISANLAHTLLSQNKLDDAETALQAALKIARENGHPELLIKTLNGLAKLALKRDDLTAVEPMLQEVYEIADRSGARRLLADAKLIHSELAAREGDSEASQAHWQQAADLLKLLMIQLEKPDWLK